MAPSKAAARLEVSISVEIRDRCLRFECDQPGAADELRRQLLLRRKEDPLAHHFVDLVEQTVDRLESEVRHADEIGVRKGERDAQPIAVRLADVADLARENLPRALALLPELHESGNCCDAGRR